MNEILLKIHYKIIEWMAKLWVVENILIAKVKNDDEYIDCIYCTILRNAVLFTCIGFVVGFIFAKWFRGF